MKRVQFVAVPTAQRPAELRRSVQSFSAHLARHGRTTPVLAFHTPRSEAEQNEVRDAMRGASAGADAPVVGLAEKLAMAKDLKRASGVSPALLEFALFHRGRHPPPTGANRNAILLWGAGRAFLSTDDDTLADLHAHPDFDRRATLQDEVVRGDPSDYFVPETGDVSAWRLTPCDPRDADGDGGLTGSIESAWAQSEARGCRAPLVFAGLAGDCGWSAPFGFWGQPLGYLALRAPTLARLTASKEGWQRVLRSRRLLRAPAAPQLARDAPGMTTCFGVDAEGELPPFMPLGRGQDLLFSALVERLRGAPSAWLPIAVAHEPATTRRFHDGELLRSAESLDLCGVLFALLETLPRGGDLAAFGRHLGAYAAHDADTFAEAVRDARRQLQGRVIGEARARAARLDLPAHWREDLERYCERAAAAAERPDTPWVLDAGAEDARGSMALARNWVTQYGALCEAWPSLWRAARTRNESREQQPSIPAASGRAPLGGRATDPVEAPARCSPYQTWLWRSYLLDPRDAAYVTFRAFRGEGALRDELLEAALRALADRHEALRCRFVATDDGEALLDVRPATELALDRRAPLGPGDRDVAREQERARAIDLVAGLPLRATLVPALETDGGWELWLAFHHIALDGVSEGIFWRELAQIEQNLHAGRPAHAGLPPLRASYRAIARKQRAALAAADAALAEERWREALAGAPAEMHASYRTLNGPRGSDAARLRLAIPAPLVANLRAVAREQHSSVAALFLTAWQAVLARWSGERDVVVAVDQANRWDEADEETIGLFMTPLPIRADLSGDPRLDALVQSNRAQMARAFSWGPIPLERLVRALGAGRRRFDLFHALFTHLVLGPPPRLAGGALTPLESEREQAGFELGLIVEESTQGIALVLLGDHALFDVGDLDRLAQGVMAAGRAMCGDMTARLSTIDWVSARDRSLLDGWNATETPFPDDRALTELLRETAQARPDAVVLESTAERLTYGALWRRAETLATRLRTAGVSRDERVGLYLDRTPRVLEAMLGVLLAGGGYVPLDPAFPRDRLAFMLEDAGVRVLLTSHRQLATLPPHDGATVVCVDEDTGATASSPPPGWRGPSADSLAYVLYTSGSTGKPKGVEITHRSLVNFLCSMAREPGLGPSDVLLALTTLSFDIAGLEMWLPQLVGARIALAGPEEAADGERLAAALDRAGVTMLQATPSTWRALFASGWAGNPRLRGLVGGEPLPLDLAQRLADACAAAWNVYGPTETTIWSTAWRIPRGALAVRIGRPIANTQIQVLDDQLRQLPPGVTGQLYIGGAGVARGYLHRPDLTRERFVPDAAREGGRLYVTGDRARWLPDGTLDFLGRDDDQIKLRGYRIEPGEIEAALLKLPEVAQAAVAIQRLDSGDARLVAYLVAKPGVPIPRSEDLRVRLRDWLLDHMLPYHFVAVERLPLTPNGKIDRRSLAALFDPKSEEAVASLAPASTLEADLVDHFSRVLGRPMRLDADFFEAGGDSLGALRLIARLAQAHHSQLTTGELFLHSTPRRMAARLEYLTAQRVSGTQVRGGHLLPMRERRGRDPVFFVHPIGGQLAPYVRLAHHIDPALPLYGLQAAVTPKPSYRSIEERCSAYVDEVMATWDGPVTLGGYSLGGVLAIEMAWQLQRRGRAVPLVFLLDTNVPAPAPEGLPKVLFRAAELFRFSWKDRWIWATDQLARRALGARPDGHELGEGRPLIDETEMALLSAQALRWRPPRRARNRSNSTSNSPGRSLRPRSRKTAVTKIGACSRSILI